MLKFFLSVVHDAEVVQLHQVPHSLTLALAMIAHQSRSADMTAPQLFDVDQKTQVVGCQGSDSTDPETMLKMYNSITFPSRLSQQTHSRCRSTV